MKVVHEYSEIDKVSKQNTSIVSIQTGKPDRMRHKPSKIARSAEKEMKRETKEIGSTRYLACKPYGVKVLLFFSSALEIDRMLVHRY